MHLYIPYIEPSLQYPKGRKKVFKEKYIFKIRLRKDKRFENEFLTIGIGN